MTSTIKPPKPLRAYDVARVLEREFFKAFGDEEFAAWILCPGVVIVSDGASHRLLRSAIFNVALLKFTAASAQVAIAAALEQDEEDVVDVWLSRFYAVIPSLRPSDVNVSMRGRIVAALERGAYKARHW